MSQLNTGRARVHFRVIYITLFGMLLFGLAVVVALPGGATFAGGPPSKTGNPASPNDMCWQLVPSPNQGTGQNNLYAVADVSPDNIWAVGSYNRNQTLVEHWNGTDWTIVPSPNSGLGISSLKAVDAISSSDVWAVGYSFGLDNYLTLVEHWNGTAWMVVPSPHEGTLSGVAVVSANDIWAVGKYTRPMYQYPSYTLVEHWDGIDWTMVPSPNPSPNGNALFGVAAVSANDVWAVGDTILHWDGSTWSNAPAAFTGNLYGVAAISSTDVWAVGDVILHWDGNAWSTVPGAVSGTLHGVAAVSSTDVWAVGQYDNDEHTLVEHWNGTDWSVVPSPNLNTSANGLYGVAALGADDVWAVGSYVYATQTLVERYGPCFTDVPEGSTFYPYVRCLVAQGIISGYPDGSFRPNNPVTRGQLAKIVSNAAGFSDPQTTQLFQDIPVGSTFFQYIGRLASRGYMSGYPCGGVGEPCLPPANLPYFRPNNKASRGQLTKIVSNAAGFEDAIPAGTQTFTDVPPNSTFWLYVERLLLNRPGVMGGYVCGGANEPCDPQQRPYFRPGNNVTRGQTSKIVANTFFPDCQATQTIRQTQRGALHK